MPSICVRWAGSESEVRRSQRLRHLVFVEELGARIDPPPGAPAGHEADLFDLICEHLLAFAGDEVIGTYRVLTADAARRVGSFYIETEFDLFRLREFRPGMRDGGHAAASLWTQLAGDHLGPIGWQVMPRRALPIDQLDCGLDAPLPPLIKGYLHCGGRLIGAPAWDPAFDVADLPMMLRMQDLPPSHRRHFTGR